MCCRYVAMPLDTPTDKRTFDEARWFLMHEGVTVFVTAGQWYVSFASSCKQLGEDGLCRQYETRPTVCREYPESNCDYVGGDYEYQMFFSHPDQMAAYGEKVIARREAQEQRRRTEARRERAARAKAKTPRAKPASAKTTRTGKRK